MATVAPTPTMSPTSPFANYDKDEAYNNMVARQICRGSDPLYASIPEDVGGLRRSEKLRIRNVLKFKNQYQYQQEYHTGVRNQSGSVSSQDASHALHVDTSPRMVSPGGSMARTPTRNTYEYLHRKCMTVPRNSPTFDHDNMLMLEQGLMKGRYSVGDNFSTCAYLCWPLLQHSPPSPSSLNTLRQQLSVGGTMSPTSHSMTGQSSPSLYFGTSRRGSISSLAESEPAHITTPRFVKDMSKYWYKPQITREDAIVLLKDKHPGSFVVRDSNSYPGAFGLALKVAHIPANVQTKSTGDPSADLVRHFLIEPTHKGVRLRGSNNEPIFGSLASLVYQHSNTPLSLPCKLMLPDAGKKSSHDSQINQSQTPHFRSQLYLPVHISTACNVLFLNTVDTESLTGPQAVARAMKVTFDTQPSPKTTVVHFKVSNQGITLTDNQRKLFFRRHYPVAAVTYCGMDPDGRKWKRETETGALMEARVFGFVARKSGGHSDNACHLFAEVDPEQPASAIVNFVTKIMIGQSGKVKP
ncbi:Tensin-1 [Mizuhopecten yessoensis]|uniref:Tensin-1 n=1 Tax=Mizuhopecten yessoensis TaxID=6573 RepID=A0A210QKG2_MIZYE|nr:Tensin-1 [Mizuhopecten yessoensis]